MGPATTRPLATVTCLKPGVLMLLLLLLMLMLMVDTVHSQSPRLQVQVTNGTTGRGYLSGRVELSTDGLQWQAVCEEMAVKEFADTVCRMKGYLKGVAVKNSTYGTGAGGIYPGYFLCSPATTNLSDCSIINVTYRFCLTTGVVCFNKYEDVLQVQLKDSHRAGSVMTGRLALTLADVGTGAACTWSFNDLAAVTACRSLGYVFGEKRDPLDGDALEMPAFWVKQLRCSGKESSLLECDSEIAGQYGCDVTSLVSFARVRCFNATVRLETTGETVMNAGVVHHYSHGKGWYEVCDRLWDDTDAGVVCRELGFVDGKALSGGQLGVGAFSEPNVQSSVTNVTCTGNERSFAECTKTDRPDSACPQTGTARSLASVICYNKSIDRVDMTGLKARLVHEGQVQTKAGWGQVEVLRYGLWGAVCANIFTDSEASVACRMMGYQGGGRAYNRGVKVRMLLQEDVYYGGRVIPTRPVWIHDLHCSGNENSLLNCSVYNWGSPMAYCAAGAGVICYNSKLQLSLDNESSQRLYGRLDVLYENERGTVCDLDFGYFDASRACLTMGYFGGSVLSKDAVHPGTGPIFMSDVRCGQFDDNLFQCRSNWKNVTGNCTSHERDVGVYCHKEVQLSRGDHQSGVVVLHKKVSIPLKMGMICNTDFSDTTATVICKQLGFPLGKALPPGAFGTAFQWSDLLTSLPRLQCAGNESSVWDCVYNVTPIAACSRPSNYASVSCYSEPDPPSAGLSHKLDLEPEVGSQKAGVVRIRDKQIWGYACGQYWTDADANVFCRQMGQAGGVAYSFESAVAEVKGPYLLLAPRCTGNESSLEQCSNLPEGYLCNGPPAGVLCYSSTAPEVTLSPGPFANSGRVVVKVDGEEGSICGRRGNSADDNARVVCKLWGFGTGAPLLLPASGKPIFMSEVACPAITQQSLFTCSNSGWRRSVDPACGQASSTEVGVVCFRDVFLGELQTTQQTMSGMPQVSRTGKSYRPLCSGLEERASDLLCLELGFTRSKVLTTGARPNPLTVTAYSMICPARATSYRNCSYVDHSCVVLARIMCYNETDDEWKWSIDDGSHGKVTVTHQGVKGEVCARNWTDNEASALCRENGFRGGVAMVASVYHLNTYDVLWVGAVTCPPGASNISRDCLVNRTVEKECISAAAAAVLCYNVSAPSFALVGGPDSSAGRVEISLDGQTGTVCDKSWSRYDARTLCRQLGYKDGVNEPFSAFGSGNGSVFLDEMRCGVFEDSLLRCIHRGWNNASAVCASHLHDAAARCFTSVKLGATESYGPVQQYVDFNYLYVCSDGFDDNAAKVVCRQLRYRSGVALYPNFQNLPAVQYGATGVSCSGLEERLEECDLQYGSLCKAGYASVVCSREPAGTSAYSVRLKEGDHGEVVVNFAGQEGSICGQDFDDKDAAVVCREVGYLAGFAYQAKKAARQDLLWLVDLNCTGREGRLDRCKEGIRPLRFGAYAPRQGGVCASKAAVYCSQVSGKIEWRLASNMSVTPSPQGRVEVRIAGTWGGVCPTFFDRNDANAICKAMGYASGDTIVNRFGPGPSKVWLSRMNCEENEEVRDCELQFLPDRVYDEYCLADRTAAVDCHGGVRLQNDFLPDDSARYGRLEVLYRARQWVPVCAIPTFTNTTASVVCRELGHASGFLQTYAALTEKVRETATLTCPALDGAKFSNCTVTVSRSSCPDDALVYLFCLPRPEPSEDLSITMSRFQGRPTAKRYGFTGTVCGRNFTDNEAAVICKQNGYMRGYALMPIYLTFANLPVIVAALNCSRGEEDSVQQCYRGPMQNASATCLSNLDYVFANVLCTSTDEPLRWRLNPEGAKVGRAEVKINGQWGLIDRHYVSPSVATVFCRSLGFASGTVSIVRSGTSEPELHVVLTSTFCDGSESSLLQCRGNWTEPDVTKPASIHAAYVECHPEVTLTRGTSATGIVMYSPANAREGPVCVTGFDSAATGVVCRQLGYDTGTSLCCSPFGDVYAMPSISRLRCTGNETLLSQCSSASGIQSCGPGEYASVACYNYTVPEAYSLGFKAGTSQLTGPLRVLYRGVEGSVCSDGWDDLDAAVACRELGFRNGTSHRHYRDPYRASSTYDGPFWSSKFACRGTEARLGDCPHVGWGNVTECKSYDYAGVLCFSEKGLAFDLAGNGSDNRGIVMVMANGTWGPLCNRNWDKNDAAVLCRSLDYADGDVIPPLSTSKAAGLVWLNSLRCTGDERRLEECVHEGFVPDSNSVCYTRYASAVCYKHVRLSTSDKPLARSGAVLLHTNGTWNLVCDAGFDDVTARAVCQELDYFDGRAVCCSAYAGALMFYAIKPGAVSLRCTGTEGSLDECIRTEPCTSGMYASVVCLDRQAQYNDSVFDVSHEAVTSDSAGRLRVKHLGVTGRVCAVGWTDEDAEVYCRSGAYSAGFAYSHTHYTDFLDETELGPFLLSQFNCTGAEKNLMDCPHNAMMNMGNCSTGHSAGVVCYNNSGVQYRLQDGGQNYGRVEMAIDGTWGTVCDLQWTDRNADVLCRSLNFTSGIAKSNAEYGEGAGPVWLSEVTCNGTESALHRCPHSGFTEELGPLYLDFPWIRPPCTTHEDDAGVFCYKGARLAKRNEKDKSGGVLLYHKGRWSYVCDWAFTHTEATVACRSLLRGYAYGVAIKGSAFEKMETYRLNVTAVKCRGDETDLDLCDVQYGGLCPTGLYASIACSDTPFNLSDRTIRTSNDTWRGPHNGIVEVMNNGIPFRICSQGWDDVDASVTCRQLGYKGGVAYIHIFRHVGPIGWRNVSCVGNETSLSQCPNTTSPDPQHCRYDSHDAGVICYNSTGLLVQLGGRNSSSSGRVELHYDGQVGAVCGMFFSSNDSRVLCRSLGFVDGVPDPPDERVPRLGTSFLNAPFCLGSEQSLLQCLNTGFNTSYISYACSTEAFVTCYNVTIDVKEMRLVDEKNRTDSGRGRVEIRLSGSDEWGTVCDDFFDEKDATVVCRQMGFAWGEAVVNQSYGIGSGRIWLDNVECLGSERTLQDCTHRGWATHNCKHDEDAGVFCHSTPKPTLPSMTTVPGPLSATTTARTLSTPAPTTATSPTTTTMVSSPTTTTTTTPRSTGTSTGSTWSEPDSTTSSVRPATTAATSLPTTSEPGSSTLGDETPQAHSADSKAVGIAVGVIVSVVLIALVAVVLYVLLARRGLLRRKLGSGFHHQRFTDEVLAEPAPDGSIAMHNQLFDLQAADPPSDPTRFMAAEGEITLGNEKALYKNGAQGTGGASLGEELDNGFSNPLYSVVQPRDSAPAQDGRSAAASGGPGASHA